VFTKDMPIPDGPRGEVVNTLMRAKKDPAREPAAEAAMLHLDAVWKLDERVRTSVYATVQTVVQPWLDPHVDRSARLDVAHRRWVDLDWLCADGQANTLYLVAPLDDQRRLAPVLGGLLGDLKDQAYQWDVAGRRLPSPLLFLVDEAGNMPLAWLPEVASTCAGIGIVLVTIWQSKAQLDAAYGRLADSVLTNHLTKIVFSGCSDASTLDYVSRLLGDEEVTRRSWSADVGGGTGRRSVSEAVAREALSPYHLLRQVRPGEAVLIHGTLPPAHLEARRWWEVPHLKQLADGAAASDGRADPGTGPGTGNRIVHRSTRTRR
jgi:type IV secretion system protein VirD4